jgi:hypothetical protein
MTICGMGWTCAEMDYEVNPDGDGKVVRRDPTLMRWDPAARRKNLADRKWTQADYWMTKDAIQERWPDADVEALTALSKPQDRKKPHDATEAWKYSKDASGAEQYNDQWRVVHHVERFTQTVFRVADPFDGKLKSFSKSELDNLDTKLEAIGQPKLSDSAQRLQQRVFWEAWVVGKVVLACGVAKVQKDFQYQAMTCFRERETGFWFGLVRLMIDPQRYANRMASLLMSILSTGAKGGLLYETGAFVNPQKAKKDWARWDSAIELTEGAIAGQKVQPKVPVQLPQGAVDFMQFAITSIRDVTGANIEMLGMRQEDQPGIVEDMRTKAGLTILAGVFDAMRLYRKRQGIVLAEFVTKFLSDGRLIRIWGQQGQEFIPLVRNPEVTEYDVVVDESPASRDVKEKTYAVLGPMIPGLMQMQVPIPPEVMDYLPIPESLAMQFKKGLMQKMQQPPQPPIELLKIQAKGEADKQVAEFKAQADQQIEAVRAQAQREAEAARMQADIQISNVEARIKAATEQARDQSQMALEREKAQLQMDVEYRKAALQSETQIKIAQIGAGLPPENEQERSVRVQGEQSSIAELVNAIMAGNAGLAQAITQQAKAHQDGMQQVVQELRRPKTVIRDPMTGRAQGLH